jgi:hypothetical protein
LNGIIFAILGRAGIAAEIVRSPPITCAFHC